MNFVKTYMDCNGNIINRDSLESKRVFLYFITKSIFDRILASIGLVVTLPIFIIIGIAIKADNEGPVIFRQKRTGQFGNEFYIYKFRTMVAENDVYDFSKSDECTKVGKFLRSTSLDELPQLYSIAIGKMSFIGPRPWIPEYYANMNEIQRHRYDVKPGLTGLAQCMGRNKIGIIRKINYDLEYIEKYSLIQDIKILFLTFATVFSRMGAEAGKGTIQKELDDLAIYNGLIPAENDDEGNAVS